MKDLISWAVVMLMDRLKNNIKVCMSRFIFLFFTLTIAFLSSLPVEVGAQAAIQKDTGHLTVTTFSRSNLNDYKNKREFRYDVKEKSLNAWDRFWIWFWNWVSEQFDKKGVKISLKI